MPFQLNAARLLGYLIASSIMRHHVCTQILACSAALFLFGYGMGTARAGMITQAFNFTVGPNVNNVPSLAFTQTGLTSDGVTFDATVTVSGDSVGRNSDGIGVGNGNSPISGGEWIFVDIAINNVVGGTVSFGGFTSISFNNYSTSPAEALIQDALVSPGFSLAATSNPFPLSMIDPFYVVGADQNGTNFRVSGVSAKFNTVPVPEPGSATLALCGMAFAPLLLGRHRRLSKVG